MSEDAKQANLVGFNDLPLPALVLTAEYSILAVNRSMCQLMDYEPSQLIGGTLQRLMNKSNWLAFQNMVGAPLAMGQTIEQFSMRLLSAAHDQVPVLISACSFADGICVIATPYDRRINFERSLIANRAEAQHQLQIKTEVEQQLRAEKQHQQALIKKLEDVSAEFVQTEKMAAIGQLAAGVAHEINNPIGYVYSNLQTLASYVTDLQQMIDAIDVVSDVDELKQLKKTLDYDFLRGDVSDLLKESAEGIERVKHIITALKDFSRKDDLALQPVDIHKALETTLSVAWNEIKYKAEVVKNFSDIPPVICHLGQVNQVFMNLLVNAAQAIEDFGTVTVSTSVENDMVAIRIADNGGGIAPDQLNRVFEPFFTTKPVGEGTGLGLALAYNIVRKHGGDLKVSSELGVGSQFTVLLPIAGPDSRSNED